MKARIRGCLVVLGLLSALATSQAALASGDNGSGSAAPLTGETLITSELGDPGSSFVTGTCNPEDESTFEFEVSGVAVGPYAGNFSEHGTITMGPALAGFQPVSFQSTFTITSPAGAVLVTGTKSLVDGAGAAACGEFASDTGNAEAIVFQANVEYEATITTAAGSAEDSGVSNVDYSDLQVRGVEGFNGFTFVETFVSTAPAPGGGDDDGDDDGGGGDDDDDDDGEGDG
jgi:hypothetical protein